MTNDIYPYPKPNPYETNKFVKWLNNVVRAGIASIIRNSPDIRVERTKDGSYLTLNPIYKRLSNWNYDFERFYKTQTRTLDELGTAPPDFNYFDPYASYGVGDVVRVDKIWYAGTDPVKRKPEFEEDTPVYIYPGVYICVQTVPSLIAQDKVDALGLKNIDKNFYRRADICYAPLYPEPKRLASRNTFFSGNEPAVEDITTYQGRYWELISLLPTVGKQCRNGKAVTVLVNGAFPPDDPSEVTALPGQIAV